MNHKLIILSMGASLLASSALAQQVPQYRPAQQMVVTTTTTNSGRAVPMGANNPAYQTTTMNPAAYAAMAPAAGAPVPVQAAPIMAPVAVAQMPVTAAPVYAAPVAVAPQVSDGQFTQSPAYKECATLANSNPIAAEQKANEWLKIDDGVGPHHCRAMAFYGQRRFGEAAQELTFTRSKIAPGNVTLRSYVAKQTAKAWMDTGRPDAAITALGEQIADMSAVRGDNANVSQLTSDLLLERAKLRVTYGQSAEAVKDLDQAVSLTPTNENVLMERATAFAQLNDTALARQDVDSVLKLNPANSKAQELKRQLAGR